MLAWALWALTLLSLPVVNRLDQRLRQAGLPELAILEPAAFPLIVAAVTAATVRAVLASRWPRHPVGWLLLAVGLSEQFSNDLDRIISRTLAYHDAAQTIATFGARLRDQVGLDTLSAELLSVVDQTMQPTRTSLWLRPRGPSTAADGMAALQSTGTN